MGKVKVFTKKANYFGQSALFSFGEVAVDFKGIAEVDAENLEALSSVGFFPVNEAEIILNKDLSEENISGDNLNEGGDKGSLSAEELESLRISLFKKKNEELEAIIANAKPDLPKEEYEGKIKKELVSLILSF